MLRIKKWRMTILTNRTTINTFLCKLYTRQSWQVRVKHDMDIKCCTLQLQLPRDGHSDNTCMTYHPWYDKIYHGYITSNINRPWRHPLMRPTIPVSRLVLEYGPLYFPQSFHHRHHQFQNRTVGPVLLIWKTWRIYYYVSIAIRRIQIFCQNC